MTVEQRYAKIFNSEISLGRTIYVFTELTSVYKKLNKIQYEVFEREETLHLKCPFR